MSSVAPMTRGSEAKVSAAPSICSCAMPVRCISPRTVVSPGKDGSETHTSLAAIASRTAAIHFCPTVEKGSRVVLTRTLVAVRSSFEKPLTRKSPYFLASGFSSSEMRREVQIPPWIISPEKSDAFIAKFCSDASPASRPCARITSVTLDAMNFIAWHDALSQPRLVTSPGLGGSTTMVFGKIWETPKWSCTSRKVSVSGSPRGSSVCRPSMYSKSSSGITNGTATPTSSGTTTSQPRCERRPTDAHRDHGRAAADPASEWEPAEPAAVAAVAAANIANATVASAIAAATN
mmetsp:Transcript_6668/g.22239  ORF Transcript_6668/g.22239 Transcript_6668/m.22239 type:complete len:291 (-) Transcript_6668:1218-2090(-)